MENMTFLISEPRYPVASTITKEDVWGDYENGNNGMIIARSEETCPYFNDKVSYKGVTIRVPNSILKQGKLVEVLYWIEYVMGAESVSKTDSDDNFDAILRCDYMCW